MTSFPLGDFLHNEISATTAELRHARYRVHAAAMIAISRVVVATFPTAAEIVVDSALRWSEPVGPTVLRILDTNGRPLLDDDIESGCFSTLVPYPADLVADVQRLLAVGTDGADLADLGWTEHTRYQWHRPLVTPRLLTGTWTFLPGVHDPDCAWACCYAQTECPVCHGHGRLPTSDTQSLCACVASVR